MLHENIFVFGLALLALSFIQNVSFTLVSRARNRDSMPYHAVCSCFSNGLWFLTAGLMFTSPDGLQLWYILPYVIGTVSGSLFGAKVAMRIEVWLGASTDSHLQTAVKKELRPGGMLNK